MRHTQLLFALLVSGLFMISQGFAQDTTLTITNYGFVGIGTTTPASMLDVKGSLGVGDISRFSNHMLSSRVAEDNEAVDVAIFGSNEGISGFEAGVYGRNYSPQGYGVYSEGNFGVNGYSTFSGPVTVSGTNGGFAVTPHFNLYEGTILLGVFTGNENYPLMRFVNSVTDQEYIDLGQDSAGDFIIKGAGAFDSAPSLKLSRTSGDVDITGNVSANGINTGSEALKTIRGVVDTDGSVIQGSGFTIERLETGVYKITFTEPFSDYPAVSGSVLNFGYLQLIEISFGTDVTVGLRNGSGEFFDSIFTFIASGGAGNGNNKTAPVLSVQ